ncbi:MAG: response regulator transcription factor [Deltaproteobacteria bacterium]|nr:response regulator transcription factor [Deltaproteobacteria bacterium]
MTIRLVLADDHAVLRAGLRAFFEEQTDPVFQVVGEASDGKRAVELCESVHPDLLVLDLSMPVAGGLETVLELRQKKNKVKILILTQFSEAIYFRRLLEAGINGYILKSARGEELVSAIRSIIKDGTYIDPNLAGLVVCAAQGKEQKEKVEPDEEAYHRLTPRERQILKLIAEGYSNKEIASNLDVAVKTVMSHRVNLMDKLGIRNRSKLIQFAIRVGLLPIR